MKILSIIGLGVLLGTAGCDSPMGRGNPADLAGLDFSETNDLAMSQPDIAMPQPDMAGSHPDLSMMPDGPPPDLTPPIPDAAPEAVNAVCANATVISDGTTLTGENSDAGRDDLAATCRHGAHGSVLYYSATLPAFAQLTVTATPTGLAPTDLVIRALDSCGASACLQFSDDGLAGDPETLTYVNTSAAPATVLVAVGSYDAPLPGTFDLTATVTQLPPPPMNLMCTMPTTVTDGTTLTGQDAGAAVEQQTNACLFFDDGEVLYYLATVPAGFKLTAKATPESAWDAVIRFIDGCGAITCLASADNAGTSGAETLNWNNLGGSDQKVIIAVGAYASGTGGKFTLNVSITQLPPPPTNITCAAAKSVTDGTTLIGEDATFASTTLTSACLPFASGNVLYYTADVPNNNAITVTVTPETSWDPTIRFLSACGATSCIGSADNGGSGTAENLNYKNVSGATQTVIIGVGSYSSSTTGAFNMTVSIVAPPPPPPNAVCATPTPVDNGTSLTGENAALGLDKLDTACLTSAHGNVLYYSLTLAMGKTLTAKATPTGVPSWDPTIRLIDTCAPASCRASVDNGASGTAETLTYTNNTAGPLSLLLAVGSYNASTSGTFNLTITIP